METTLQTCRQPNMASVAIVHMMAFTDCPMCRFRFLLIQLDPEAEDLMRGLLTWDPAERLGSRGVHQIMQHPFFAPIAWSRLELEVRRDQQLYADMAAKQQQQEEVKEPERELIVARR